MDRYNGFATVVDARGALGGETTNSPVRRPNPAERMRQVQTSRRVPVLITCVSLALCCTARPTHGQSYPNASLDQATHETVSQLDLQRFDGLDEEGLQAEYEWALEMAVLCLENLDSIGDREAWWQFPYEFQRHAGRTARFRGFAEQAIDDYDTAILFARESLRRRPTADTRPGMDLYTQQVEDMILRDIADTYFTIGATKSARDLTNWIIGRVRTRQETAREDTDRLARIDQREGRFFDSVSAQQSLVREIEPIEVAEYIGIYPELAHVAASRGWAETVRRDDVRGVLDEIAPRLNTLRELYCGLARACRLNGQFSEAEHALETAELTTWGSAPFFRENLDLWVDRERAFLALGRGRPAESLKWASRCLEKYGTSPPERVELLDLASRALEQLGQLQAAFDRLKEAIAIVEQRRANLIFDVNKQTFVGQYADLYRRAAELVIRIGQGRSDAGSQKDGRLASFDRRTVEASLEWAERSKGRAMLDAMRRLDSEMAAARDRGDLEAIRKTRDLAGKVVTIHEIQNAAWLPKGAALLEYMLTERGAWVWVVTADSAHLTRIDAAVNQIEENAEALRQALLPTAPRDESWIKPATWLYDALIRPVAGRIRESTHLVIVADGVLREIPFETFVDRMAGDDWKTGLLISRKVISYAPSATVLEHISRRPRGRNWKSDYWGFASTRFRSGDLKAPPAPVDPVKEVLRSVRGLDFAPLPMAEDEIKSAAGSFPAQRRRTFIDYKQDGQTAKDVLLEASRTRVLAGVRYLHFATHTLLAPERPFDTGLVLSPPYVDDLETGAMTRTEATGRSNRSPTPPSRDGIGAIDPPGSTDVGDLNGLPFRPTKLNRAACILSLREIAELDLGCELVVLSSCQGLGGSPVDGDWLTGLARAFFVAGSEAVICTLWDVSDADAQEITSATFHAMQFPSESDVGSPAEALRRAKLSLIGAPRHSHPANWAGFVCYGGLSGR